MVSLVPGLYVIILTYHLVYFCEYVCWYGVNIHHHKVATHPSLGVVVDNFSYVFQASGSETKSITREQMRAFKKVWAQFSNPRTGYLERHRFAAFFSVGFLFADNLLSNELTVSIRNSAVSSKFESFLRNTVFPTFSLSAGNHPKHRNCHRPILVLTGKRWSES